MRNQLQRAVLALAQPADVQLALFPDFVCKADELALDFEDGRYEIVGHESEISGDQRAALNALDDLITSMSGQQNAAFWTDEAVRSDAKWEDIRTAAKATAATFGWELRPPSPSGAIYIPTASHPMSDVRRRKTATDKSAGIRFAQNAGKHGFSGSGGGTRTPDTRIMIPLL